MKFATLMLLVLLAAQGCATAPPAVQASAGVQQITWTRGVEAPAFVDSHGVCHTFSRDTQEAMRGLGSQVKACFERALPVGARRDAETRGVKVALQEVTAARIDELFAERTGQSVLHAAGRRKASVFAVRGFYVYRGDTCHVVVADHNDFLSTVGHEFKHCLDGEYHDERGLWRHQRAG